jgi:hypothetical protein
VPGNVKIKIFKNIVLPVVSYGCETLTLNLREGQRQRMLKRIFGPKRDEIIRG